MNYDWLHLHGVIKSSAPAISGVGRVAFGRRFSSEGFCLRLQRGRDWGSQSDCSQRGLVAFEESPLLVLCEAGSL